MLGFLLRWSIHLLALMVAGSLIRGIRIEIIIIESFRAAFFGAIVISFISWGVNVFVGGSGKFVFIKRENNK